MDERTKEGLMEFLVLQRPPNETPEFSTMAVQTFNWTINQTKLFLDLYKKYRSKVGTFQIKNLKRLWEILAQELNKVINSNVTPGHCENRWRVLERAYKKYIDSQSKTGQGKKYFEYVDDMDEIFKGKRNVKPVVLLSSFTIEKVSEDEADTECPLTPKPSTSEMLKPKNESLKIKRDEYSNRKTTPVVSKNLTLLSMKKERREYQEERLKIEREKLELQKEKLKAMQEKNLLLKERNELLKERKSIVCSQDFV